MGRRGKKGRFFEYREERNKDILRAFNECIVSAAATDNMSEVYCRMVVKPSKRFWVSEEQASKVISHMMKGNPIDHMSNNKKKMFHEIYGRIVLLREKNPDTPLYLLVEEVVSSEAPCFYMTPKSAKVIISQIKTKCYKQRLQSLPFLR